MVNEIDFVLIGHCKRCENPIYEHFENGIYMTCLCKFYRIPDRKLKLVKNKDTSITCKYENNEEGMEIYGKTS